MERKQGKMSASIGPIERPRSGNTNTIFKSGHLLISYKGLGWKSWKKRWFILTRTSLVFFKNDPGERSHRGGELNLTLGGIHLNNSGSVVVREDKKLLTVIFPDGREGGAITLKSETYEDLLEWKTALTNALSQAPDACPLMEHNGIFRSDTSDFSERSFQQSRERRLVNSLVVGRPIFLALEDTDGGPSFLEKALRFLEKYGVEVKEILRQSADVEEVDRRIQEYEQGKTEFYPSEDAHVIGDCVKYVLRELPSSPVTPSGCTALLNAFKIEGVEARVAAMRITIQEAFPEPNKRLLQRVLKMMHTISSHASVNRMTQSSVAVCMAPLLLRPLVAGKCGPEDNYDIINGDDSSQLLAAANAAYNAHAIVTLLLEQYDHIFGDDILHRCSVSLDSQTDDAQNEGDHEADFDGECRGSEKLSENSGQSTSELYGYKERESLILQAKLERRMQDLKERHFTLEQDVARLHQQMQGEADLQAALGFSLSVSSSRGMDSKTRAELEEIALAEADMARLKQKVAQLQNQLNQRHGDQCQLPPNPNSHQKYLQSDFDTALDGLYNKRRQRTRDLLSENLRSIRGQLLTSRTTRRLTFWKRSVESSDSKSIDAASTTLSMDDPLDFASVRSSTSSMADVMEAPRRSSSKGHFLRQ